MSKAVITTNESGQKKTRLVRWQKYMWMKSWINIAL